MIIQHVKIFEHFNTIVDVTFLKLLFLNYFFDLMINEHLLDLAKKFSVPQMYNVSIVLNQIILGTFIYLIILLLFSIVFIYFFFSH